jgi:hypothetical protein
MSESNVHFAWASEPVESYTEAIYQFLFHIEKSMEADGWDCAPVLGVVSAETIGGFASIGLEVPRMTEEFNSNPIEALSDIAYATLEAEFTDNTEEQSFLNQAAHRGFQGWLVAAEWGTHQIDDEDAVHDEEITQRIIIFVDVDANRFGVARIKGADEAHKLEYLPGNPITRSLNLLNAASVMAIVRRNMGEPD